MPTSPESPRHSEWLASINLPTSNGVFTMHVFRTTAPDATHSHQEHVAQVYGDVTGKAGLPVRVHSECLTGEVFGSLKCDCRDQLDMALSEIVRLGAGMVLYYAPGRPGNWPFQQGPRLSPAVTGIRHR